MATETQCASVMNWWCWDDKCPTFIKLSILWKTCSPQPCTRLLRLNFCKKERERFKCMTTLNRNQKKKKKLIWSIHNQIFEWKHSTFLCSSLLSAGYLDFSTWRFSVMFETAVLSGHPTQSELLLGRWRGAISLSIIFEWPFRCHMPNGKHHWRHLDSF